MKKLLSYDEFVNESSKRDIEKFMLLIWDANGGPKPNLLMAFTSDKEDNLDIPKGELADMIEKVMKNIDPDDFETEVISTKDFMDDYASPRNPNRININRVHVEYI